MSSKSFGSSAPAVPHLIVGQGGLSGEIHDLRSDIDVAFLLTETPGLGGSGLVSVDEWTNPLAADDDYVLVSTAAAVAAATVTTLTHGTLPDARNLTVTCTVTGTGEGAVVVTGVDVNGAVIHEHFTVPAATAVVTGSSAFKTVTSVLIPALTVGMTVLLVKVGSGNKLGLTSKAKLRTGVVHVIGELMDGSAATGTYATPAVGAPNGTYLPGTVPNATHDYCVTYERDLS